MVSSKRAAVYQDYLDSIPAPIVHDAGGGVVYTGYTERLGVGTDEPKWLIIRTTTAGGITTPEYAQGKSTFESVWDDRTSLTYGR
tara:strand:- start:61 stop:315 length:255 start_codon:yes stop_codon:yes gene_type:complete